MPTTRSPSTACIASVTMPGRVGEVDDPGVRARRAATRSATCTRDRHGAQPVGDPAGAGRLLAEHAEVEGDPLVGRAPLEAADPDRARTRSRPRERLVEVESSCAPRGGSACPAASWSSTVADRGAAARRRRRAAPPRRPGARAVSAAAPRRPAAPGTRRRRGSRASSPGTARRRRSRQRRHDRAWVTSGSCGHGVHSGRAVTASRRRGAPPHLRRHGVRPARAAARATASPTSTSSSAGTVFLDIIFTGLPALPAGRHGGLGRGHGLLPGRHRQPRRRRQPARAAHLAGGAFGDDAYGDFCWPTLAEQEHVDLAGLGASTAGTPR